MEKITYIFLHFIIHSFLFYSNIQGFLLDKYLNKYIIDGNTCFDIIEKDWELMKDNLGDIDIGIFLNLIFNDTIKKFISCPELNKKEDVIKFEKEINDIIINKNKNMELIKGYTKQNEFLININPNLPKTIIQEIYPSNIYSEDKYPDLKYFYMAEFPSKENFIEKFEEKNKDKYPIINIIINENEFHKKLKLLKYIPIINTLCNYMINYVSYRYTREEAKLILITEVISDKKIIELSKEFTKIYKEIWPYIKNPQIGDNFSDLEENKLYLSNLCLDSHKDTYGFVLLEIYKKMAEWQNLFIDTVIKSLNNNLNSYEDMFNLDISLQDCQEEQILNLPSFEKENNINLMKIILDNSLRNDNKIIYNYEQIENELASSMK